VIAPELPGVRDREEKGVQMAGKAFTQKKIVLS
jgi:hypothetical protein